MPVQPCRLPSMPVQAAHIPWTWLLWPWISRHHAAPVRQVNGPACTAWTLTANDKDSALKKLSARETQSSSSYAACQHLQALDPSENPYNHHLQP